MEVTILSKNSFPENSILSIRAGPVKRQAPVTSEKPFRFAKGEAKDNLLKFDILQPVGSGYAVLKPFEDRYRVILNDQMSCEIDIKHVDGGPSSPSGADRSPDKVQDSAAFSVQNAQSYLDDHGVLQFIQGMIQALVKERPDDPYKYMGRHILNGYDVEAKSVREDGSPAVPEQQKSSVRIVHEQARETMEKLLTPQGAAPPVLASPKAAPQESQSAKCAPPADDMDAEPAVPAEDIDDLRVKAKELLVQGFHSGSLEASLANKEGSADEVEDLRAKAKGILLQGFHNGSLESTLLDVQAPDAPAADAGAAADAGKVVEERKDEKLAEESKEDTPAEAAGEQVPDGGNEAEKPAEEGKEAEGGGGAGGGEPAAAEGN